MKCSKEAVRYPDFDTATMSMHYIRSRATKHQKVPKRVYYCHICKGYHLTAQDKRLTKIEGKRGKEKI